MIYFNLIDKEDNILSEVEINNFKKLHYQSKKVKKVQEYKKINLLRELSYGVSIFLSHNKGEDFIIQHLSPQFLKIIERENDDKMQGCLYSNSFPTFVELGIFDKFQEVYETGISQEFSIVAYKDDDLIKHFNYKIVKTGTSIYTLAKDETEKKLLEEKEKELRENSIQGIVSIKEGKIQYINKKAMEISGYSIEDLEGKPIISIISLIKNYNPKINSVTDIHEKLINKEIIFSDSIMELIAKDGSIKYLKTHTNLLNAKKEVTQTTFVDITEEKLAEMKALKLESNLKTIEDVAKIVIVSKENGKFTWNDEIYKILEIDPDDSSEDIDLIYEHLVPEDKIKYDNIKNEMNKKEKLFHTTIRVKTKTGKIKYLSIFTKSDKNSNYHDQFTGFVQEISKEKENELEALKLKNTLNLIEPKSKIAFVWWSKELGHEATPEFSKIFEIENTNKNKEKHLKSKRDILFSHLSKDHMETFKRDFKEFLNTDKKEFETITKIITGKGNLKYIKIYIVASRVNGKLLSNMGYIQDITEQVLKEKKLIKLNNEKEYLINEIHHKVKNNLQVILSLIKLENRDNKNTQNKLLESTESRIESIALAHEKIYKSSNFSKINAKQFISKDIDNILKIYDFKNEIKVKYEIPEDLELSISLITSLSLIYNELITNSTKYAFTNNLEIKEKNINISLDLVENKDKNEKIGKLIISDNVKGLNEKIDLENPESLGFILVKNIINQIDGEIKQDKTDEAIFTITFPVK